MFLASKLAFVKAELKNLFAIVFIVSIISLIPTIGWVLGLGVFVFLLQKVSDASFVDCIWVVAFTKLITLGLVVIFSGLLAS